MRAKSALTFAARCSPGSKYVCAILQSSCHPFCCLPPLPRRLPEAFPQIGKAPARNRFRAFLEIEHLHRHETIVARFLQRGRDGPEVHLPESGPFEVRVIRVKMREVRPGFADDLR